MQNLQLFRMGRIRNKNLGASIFKDIFVVCTLLIMSCSSGGDGDSDSALDTYVEFDITINGVNYNYFNDSDDLRGNGDGGSIFVMFGNSLDSTWPEDRLRALLRIDLKGFTNADTFAEGVSFDMSENLFNTILVTATILSPTNTLPGNLQRRDYNSDSGGLHSGTVTLTKYILPGGSDSSSEAYRNNVQFDIELHDVVLDAYTFMTGTGIYSFPDNITVNYARFCKLASGCNNKKQSANFEGQYTGGPVTVTSSNCLSAADDGDFTFNNSSLSITEYAWENFKATAIFQDVVEGVSVVSTEEITGTISNSDVIGAIEDTFTIAQTVVSSGTGTVSGTVAGDTINLSFIGRDTSGDTCDWTADASFIKN